MGFLSVEAFLYSSLLRLELMEHFEHLILILSGYSLGVCEGSPHFLNLFLSQQSGIPFHLQQVLQLLDVGLFQHQLLLNGTNLKTFILSLVAYDSNTFGCSNIIILKYSTLGLEG